MIDMKPFIGRHCEVIFKTSGVFNGYTGRVDSVDAQTISVTPESLTDGELAFENGQPADVPKTYPGGGRIPVDTISQINVLDS
jgi:hypothetical protein